MDGWQWHRIFGKWALAGCLFAGVVGCETTSKNPFSSNLPSPPPPSPTSSASGKAVFVQEPEDPNSAKDGPLAANTLLLAAAYRVEVGTKDPGKSPAEREQLMSDARRLYNEVLQREPQNVDALIGLAQMYQLTGETQKLLDTEARMRDQHAGNAKVWAWIAVRQGQAREWDNAAESYHQAAKLDPDNRLYRIHLGFTLARAKRYEEGYAWLSRSMRENEARYNLAQMMLHNGDTDKARQQLEYALQIDANYKPAATQLAAMNSGGAAPAPTLPANPAFDNPIRQAGYNEAERPTIPTRPTMSPPDPLPLGMSNNDRLPPPYTATTGWDSTLPPRR